MRAGPALGLAGILAAAPAGAHEGHAESAPPPPRFEAPAPGSYALPPIQRVGRHRLLDANGEAWALGAPAPGRVGFVAFVYLSCPDACPRTLGVLQRFDREIARDPTLRGRVELATVSFDPARDTPVRMAALRENLAPRGTWRFLTAPDEARLAPVLADYGQDVRAVSETRLGHVLKVFLLDHRGDVRNVYSTGFLDLRLLRNDALTVLQE